MTNLDTILQQLKRGLEDLYGPRLRGLYLFGSHARGEADEDSDIDVAMVLDDYASVGQEIRRSLDVVAEVSLAHDCVVALVPMRLADWSARSEPIIRVAQREGRAIA